jgi:hypothetical protein
LGENLGRSFKDVGVSITPPTSLVELVESKEREFRDYRACWLRKQNFMARLA